MWLQRETCNLADCVSVFIVICRVKWVKTGGVEYKVDVGVILSVDEDDLPVVGCVHDIYIVNEFRVVFNTTKFTTTFEPHFRAYLLNEQVLEDSTFIYQAELFSHTPVHIRRSQVLGLTKYIILPHAVFAL